MKITRLAAFAALALPAVCAAQAQPDAIRMLQQPPPKYTSLRWDEDYSYLKDPSRRTDFFDPVKYVPLDESGDSYASVGGQARYRYEYFNNYNFGAGPQDEDGYGLTRLMAHLDLHLTPYFRAFVQGKSAMEDGREGGPRPSDADETDVEQLFADFRLPLADDRSVTLRAGRQEMQYGSTRLIAASDWTNVRRAFEGAKVMYADPSNSLDVFWVRPVLVDKEEPNEGDGNTSFAGAWDTLQLPQLFGPAAKSGLDVYFLALDQTVGPGVSVDTDTYTLGTRLFSKPKPWDFDVELDYQFGQSGSGDIAAWSVATEGGYTFDALPCSPRPFLGFDIASGDRDAASADKQTFNQLFPNGHVFFGYMDFIGRQNIVDVHPGLDLLLVDGRPYARRVTLRGEYHTFWRQSAQDAVYTASGAVLRASSGSDQLYIGSEVDFLVTWQVDRHTLFYAGYSHFFTGTFLQETGPSQDADFLYAAVTYTF